MHVTIDKWSYYPKCLCLRISNYLSLRWWRRWHVGVYLIGCFVTCGSVFHIWVRMVQKKKFTHDRIPKFIYFTYFTKSLRHFVWKEFEISISWYHIHNLWVLIFFSIHIFVPYLPNFYESIKVTNVSTFKV